MNENITEVEMMCGGEPLAAIIRSTCSSTASTPMRPVNVLKYPNKAPQAGEFSGVLTHEITQLLFYMQRNEDIVAIDEIMDKLQTEGLSSSMINKPVLGQACMAKYAEDEQWYRAEIQDDQMPADQVEVLYVDFGNKDKVNRSDILELSEGLCGTPPYAVPCRIINEAPEKSLSEWAETAGEQRFSATCILVYSTPQDSPFTPTLIQTIIFHQSWDMKIEY